MKRELLYEILRRLKKDRRLARKVKLLAVVGLVSFFALGGLAVWAGLSALSSLTTIASQAIQSPLVHENLNQVKSELIALPRVQPLSCWSKAQSLMAAQPWLEKSALRNLDDLRIACFDRRTDQCDGAECEQQHETRDFQEGRTI